MKTTTTEISWIRKAVRAVSTSVNFRVLSWSHVLHSSLYGFFFYKTSDRTQILAGSTEAGGLLYWKIDSTTLAVWTILKIHSNINRRDLTVAGVFSVSKEPSFGNAFAKQKALQPLLWIIQLQKQKNYKKITSVLFNNFFCWKYDVRWSAIVLHGNVYMFTQKTQTRASIVL